MRCNHFIEKKRRCVRKSQESFCYQHQNQNALPDDLLNIVYSYSFADLSEEITRELWNRLSEKGQLKSFIESFSLPENTSYDDFVLYVTLLEKFPIEDVLKIIHYDHLYRSKYEKMFDYLVERRNIDIIDRFVKKIEPLFRDEFYSLFAENLPILGIDIIEKIPQYLYPRMFSIAETKEMKEYIFETVHDKATFIYDYVYYFFESEQRTDQIRIAINIILPIYIEKKVYNLLPIIDNFLLESYEVIPTEDLIDILRDHKYLTYYESENISNIFMSLPHEIREREAIDLLERTNLRSVTLPFVIGLREFINEKDFVNIIYNKFVEEYGYKFMKEYSKDSKYLNPLETKIYETIKFSEYLKGNLSETQISR